MLLVVVAVSGCASPASTTTNHMTITVNGADTAQFAGEVSPASPSAAPGDALATAAAACDFSSSTMQSLTVAFPSDGVAWLLVWRNVQDSVLGTETNVSLAAPGSHIYAARTSTVANVSYTDAGGQRHIQLSLSQVELQKQVRVGGGWSDGEGSVTTSLAIDAPC
jgi:hypothetical protein